ncbi:hypothetical protein, partial [Streptomyces galilaeus]|uniref:hypothetical protein n=1 Tax=Streptomyces galilaeus TaxID=33899 RepID=UPI0038F7E9F0
MPHTSTTVAASAKNSDVINKIILFHCLAAKISVMPCGETIIDFLQFFYLNRNIMWSIFLSAKIRKQFITTA